MPCRNGPKCRTQSESQTGASGLSSTGSAGTASAGPSGSTGAAGAVAGGPLAALDAERLEVRPPGLKCRHRTRALAVSPTRPVRIRALHPDLLMFGSHSRVGGRRVHRQRRAVRSPRSTLNAWRCARGMGMAAQCDRRMRWSHVSLCSFCGARRASAALSGHRPPVSQSATGAPVVSPSGTAAA